MKSGLCDVTIHDDRLSVTPRGINKLWGLRWNIDLPLDCVKGATVDPEIVDGWWKGWRAPGLNTGSRFVGTFHRDEGKQFWCVLKDVKPVVITLDDNDDKFDQLILSVDNPRATVDEINAAISTR